MITISDVAYAYREASKALNSPISLSHSQQLVAAALGHQSLAAFQASGHEISSWMEYIGHIVFDYDLLLKRSKQLSIPYSDERVLALTRQAFSTVFPKAKQHQTEEELINAYRDAYHDQIFASDRISPLIAESFGKTGFEIRINGARDYTYSVLPSGGMSDQLLWGSIVQKGSDGRALPNPIIDFQIHLALARTGLRSVRAPLCTVTWARVRGDDGVDPNEEDGPPQVSLVQALAEEFNITLEEASELEEAPVIENASDDGLIYSYIFDFEGYASPELEKKLGALQRDVGVNFFDRVYLNPYD